MFSSKAWKASLISAFNHLNTSFYGLKRRGFRAEQKEQNNPMEGAEQETICPHLPARPFAATCSPQVISAGDRCATVSGVISK